MVSGNDPDAARAIAIAKHQIGARPLVAPARGRGHGVAVDQDRGAEFAVQAHEQAAQRAVIGLVEPVDPPQRLGDRNALIIDFLGIAHHARDRAEPAGHPH